MTQHGALSIVAYIATGQKQQVIALCKEIEDNDVETNPIIPFAKLTTVHFARFVVLDESTDAFGNPVGARLVFTTNYDEPYDNHLGELLKVAGKGLWQMFSLCQGFPAKATYSEDALLQYLKTVTTHTETFYVGVGHRSVLQIRKESELREEIENFLDQQQTHLRSLSKQQIRQKILDFVHNNPALAWAKTPAEKASFAWLLAHWAKFVLLIIGSHHSSTTYHSFCYCLAYHLFCFSKCGKQISRTKLTKITFVNW